MGGWGLGRRILGTPGGLSRFAEQGFTLIESMIALSIAIVVLLANIYLFNTSQKDFAMAKSVTEATNLASSKIADFRAMAISRAADSTDINRSSPCVSGGPLNVRRGGEQLCTGCAVCSDQTICASDACLPPDFKSFITTWTVSDIDLQQTNPPVADLVGDLVKIKVDVFWMAANKRHQVTMTTFTTGKAQ